MRAIVRCAPAVLAFVTTTIAKPVGVGLMAPSRPRQRSTASAPTIRGEVV